jgi:hypothetical protein
VTHPLDAFVGCLAANVAAARGIDLTDESPTGRTDDSGRVFAGAAEARTCSLEPTVGAGLTAASLAYCATSVLAGSVTRRIRRVDAGSGRWVAGVEVEGNVVIAVLLLTSAHAAQTGVVQGAWVAVAAAGGKVRRLNVLHAVAALTGAGQEA